MSNITTTIEQSKHLLELGLDPNTADMNWFGNEKIGVPYDLELLSYKKRSMYHHCLPAWSLTALLEVMPITITKDGIEHKLKVFPSGLFSTHSDTSKWTLQYCGRDYSYRSKDKYPILVAVTQYDLITAAYEMVEYLLVHKLITFSNDEKD